MPNPDTPSRPAWWRRERWRFALAAFAVGACYSLMATLIGLEARIGGVDVSLAVALLLEVTFAAFGFLIGLLVEARRRERIDAEAARARLEELAVLRERLAQTEKLASLGQLASTVAHEVRNPLAILRAMTQNLAEDLATTGEPRPSAVDVCGSLVDEIDRLSTVTSRLVDFARPVVLRRRRVRLDGLARRVVDLASAASDRRFELEGAADLEVDVDPDLLTQVLLGLLDNAAAASGEKGRILLIWRCVGPSPGCVEVRVEDEGPGVREELREKIFDPFFTTRPDGHGLGLAVARSLVEVHGGTLDVEDAGLGGAAFVLALPQQGRSVADGLSEGADPGPLA
ncbi:MAG: ATP-binding protein [Acidobacteriota bacterium]